MARLVCRFLLCCFLLVVALSGNVAPAKAGDPRNPDVSVGSELNEHFRIAATSNNPERLLSLLEQHPTVTDVVFPSGDSLLGAAAFEGNIKAVEELLRRQADPDLGQRAPLADALRGALGEAPASRLVQYELVSLLLKAGANYEIYYLDDVSFVEALILDVCDSNSYSDDLLYSFNNEHTSFTLHKTFLQNSKKLHSLAKVDILDSSCFSFFAARITLSKNT